MCSSCVKFSKDLKNHRLQVIKKIIKVVPLREVKRLISYINKKAAERKNKNKKNNLALSLMPEGTSNPELKINNLQP